MTNQLSQETLKIDINEPAKLFLTAHEQKLYINRLIALDRKILKARNITKKRSWWHG